MHFTVHHWLGHPAGNLMKTREESLSSYSVSMLSAVQISCHIAEGETDEDWSGWFHLNNFMLWLAELSARRPKTFDVRGRQTGRNKDPGASLVYEYNYLPFEEKITTSNENSISFPLKKFHSLGLIFFRVDKKTIFICVFLSLLWFLCFYF